MESDQADRPSLLPLRKTARLRHGRFSIPGTRYFLTVCTQGRDSVLTQSDQALRLNGALQTLHRSGDFTLLAATIMPDHAHLLFTLGSRLTLGQAMAKFKSTSRDFGRAPWNWQADGFEHRLRPHELIEDYGLYIYMNPYRAGLIPSDVAWPWWCCPEPSLFRFTTQLAGHGTPPAEWFGVVEEAARRITTGE